MRRPFVSSRPIGPFVSKGKISYYTKTDPVDVTVLIGTKSSVPAMGRPQTSISDSIQSEISRDTGIDSNDLNVFTESLVALELDKSIGMVVVKVKSGNYSINDAESDLDTMVNAVEELSMRVEDTYIHEGDYFGQ